MAGKKKFKIGLDAIISWGATVVIIGAMFKILHLPGGALIIGIGLGVEAFLFFIMGFVPPPKEPEWHKVYPELREDFDGELPQASSRQLQVAAPGSTAALDRMMADAKIGPELIESLGAGLRNFGEKVSAISNIADASTATNEFSQKIRSTSQRFDELNNAFEKASANLSEIGNANTDTRAYHEQVNALAKNLSALNAVYELELQDSNAHLKSMNRFYSNLSQTMQNFNESMEDSQQFKEEVAKLSRNLSSLNAVYGNMLSAMNQPRA
ncbi:MAG TPA: gliding motility protein GldL [Sphingobacteriaceae bacterium]